MPYKLRKSPGKNLYWVVSTETGRKHSILPLPLKRAEAQMKALYARESGYPPLKRGGDEPVEKDVEMKHESFMPSPHQAPFPISVPEPQEYISRDEAKQVALGDGWYTEHYNTAPIVIRKPSGYKSPVIRQMYNVRAMELSNRNEYIRRREGLSSRGNLI